MKILPRENYRGTKKQLNKITKLKFKLIEAGENIIIEILKRGKVTGCIMTFNKDKWLIQY